MIWIAAYLYVAGAVATLMVMIEGVRSPIVWRVIASVVFWPVTVQAILAIALVEAARDAARKAGV